MPRQVAAPPFCWSVRGYAGFLPPFSRESSTETCSALAMTGHRPRPIVGAERGGFRRGNLARSAYTALDVIALSAEEGLIVHRCLLIVLANVLASCATTAGYEKLLSSWVGAQEIDLVRSWGPPIQSYETGGRKFIVYSSSRTVYLPGSAPSYQTTVIGNTAYTNAVGGSPPMNIGKSCTTTFELDGSKVVSWSYKGNDCKAKLPRQ